MTAEVLKLFREGDLQGCLAAAQGAVRVDPAAPAARLLLAELLMVLGQWDRAQTQLKVLQELDASMILTANAYAAAIGCERVRTRVFGGEISPSLIGDPEPWMGMLVEALKRLADDRQEEADTLRLQAAELAPATPGAVNGRPFEWIADADSRLGAMLELVLDGRYYWTPWHRIRRVKMDPPTAIRDRVWLPCQVTFANEGEAIALIPVRYPGSEDQSADIQRGRQTEWRSLGGEGFAGFGQRMFATSAEEVALFDVRTIELEPVTGS